MFGKGNVEEKQETITISREQFNQITTEIIKDSMLGENKPEKVKENPMLMIVEGMIITKVCHDLEEKLFGKKER